MGRTRRNPEEAVVDELYVITSAAVGTNHAPAAVCKTEAVQNHVCRTQGYRHGCGVVWSNECFVSTTRSIIAVSSGKRAAPADRAVDDHTLLKHARLNVHSAALCGCSYAGIDAGVGHLADIAFAVFFARSVSGVGGSHKNGVELINPVGVLQRGLGPGERGLMGNIVKGVACTHRQPGHMVGAFAVGGQAVLNIERGA